MNKALAVVAVAAAVLMADAAGFDVGSFAQAPQKGGGDTTGPYEVVRNWPQNWCGDGFVIGSTAGIWAESPDRVIILARGCLPALQNPTTTASGVVPARNASDFSLAAASPANHPRWDHIVNIVDRNGRLVESWEQHNALFVRPHRIIVNPYDPDARSRRVP